MQAKLPGWVWPVFATLLLVAGLIAGGIMLFVSWNHPSLQVDTAYYDQAVHYDKYKAQRKASAELGWQAALQVERVVSIGVKEVQVTITLLDRDGLPVEDAEVAVAAFHLAHAGDIYRQFLPETGPGEYGARMRLRKIGIWEFQLLAKRDQELFTTVLSREF
jgi:nitrogen fixation protein FixH